MSEKEENTPKQTPSPEMVPPPGPKKQPAPSPAPVEEFDEATKQQTAAMVASWGAPVRRVFTGKARRGALRLYRANPNMTKEEFVAAVKNDPEVVGLDVATILALITLAYKLYQLWKSRKANAAEIPEDPEDPRAIEDPVMESEDGIEMV